MSNMSKVEKLAEDFKPWGRNRILRIQAGVRKWGVVFSSWFDEKKGSGWPISYALGWTPKSRVQWMTIEDRAKAWGILYRECAAHDGFSNRALPVFTFTKREVLRACQMALKATK